MNSPLKQFSNHSQEYTNLVYLQIHLIKFNKISILNIVNPLERKKNENKIMNILNGMKSVSIMAVLIFCTIEIASAFDTSTQWQQSCWFYKYQNKKKNK